MSISLDYFFFFWYKKRFIFFILLVQSFNHAKQKQVICQESTLPWSNVMIKELGGIEFELGGIPPKSLIINFYLFNFFTFYFLTLKKKINSRIETGSCFINSQSQLLKAITIGVIPINYK